MHSTKPYGANGSLIYAKSNAPCLAVLCPNSETDNTEYIINLLVNTLCSKLISAVFNQRADVVYNL